MGVWLPQDGLGRYTSRLNLKNRCWWRKRHGVQTDWTDSKQTEKPKDWALVKGWSFLLRPATHQKIGSNSQRSSPRNTLHSNILQGKKNIRLWAEAEGYREQPNCHSSISSYTPKQGHGTGGDRHQQLLLQGRELDPWQGACWSSYPGVSQPAALLGPTPALLLLILLGAHTVITHVSAAHPLLPSSFLTRPLLKASLFSPSASSADARVKSASPAMGKYSLSIFLAAIMASAWKGGHTFSTGSITAVRTAASFMLFLFTFAPSKGTKFGWQELPSSDRSPAKQGQQHTSGDTQLLPQAPDPQRVLVSDWQSHGTDCHFWLTVS